MTKDAERAERITMLTDFLLAAVAGGLALPLLSGSAGDDRSEAMAWGLTLLFTAAAAGAGGTFHGLRHRLGARPLGRLWRATLLLSAPIGFFLLTAAALGSESPLLRLVVLVLALAKLVALVVLLVRTGKFAWVAYDSGVSLLLVGGLVAWRVAAEGGFPGGGWILGGVVLSLVGAAAQQRGWRRDRYFDHNDIFHLVQAGACYLFFQGAGQG
jgi:hypothetical protein